MMDTEVAQKLKLKVADIVLETSCEQPQIRLKLDGPHSRFLVEEGHAEVQLRVHYGHIPYFTPEELGEQVFDSGSHWSLYQNDGQYVIPFISPATGPVPYRVAVFTSEFQDGALFVRPYRDLPDLKAIGNEPVLIDPFEYPLDELLMVNLLGRGRGVNFHGCAVKMDERGLLFCGTSGAGKSTIANLWKAHQVGILSDDRLIVRRQEGTFFVHGTPWHGDAHTSLNDKAPLSKVFFLKQARENRITLLPKSEAAARLLVVSFPTFYYPQGMAFTLGLIQELVEKVPCYELGFTPDQRALDMVLRDE